MENKKKVIYIIEDDISINHGIALTLGTEFEYKHYYSLKEIEKIELADLIILDINLPDGNGFEYLKKLRETYETPVLILTANDTEVDEVMYSSLFDHCCTYSKNYLEKKYIIDYDDQLLLFLCKTDRNPCGSGLSFLKCGIFGT